MDTLETIQIDAFSLPFSRFASAQAREAFARTREIASRQEKEENDLGDLTVERIQKSRKRADEEIIFPLLCKQQARWPDALDIQPRTFDGVYTEIFTPKAGVSPKNERRILVNMHGGGFVVGSRTHGRLESIPLATLLGIRVVSIDYRMAPEHRFPAGSEDVATVYRALLKDYKPQNIGLYGASAGGVLAAQAIAWFSDKGLPIPGAVGMFGGTGQSSFMGDSSHLAVNGVFGEKMSIGQADSGFEISPYFKGADPGSALVSPMKWPDVLVKFPPSLLLEGARSIVTSSLIDANNRLCLAGVPSRLHLWDGLGHCFYLDPDLPESGEAERIMIAFFDEYLGH